MKIDPSRTPHAVSVNSTYKEWALARHAEDAQRALNTTSVYERRVLACDARYHLSCYLANRALLYSELNISPVGSILAITKKETMKC